MISNVYYRSEPSNPFSFRCNKQNAFKVMLVVGSLLRLGLSAAIYFSWQHYLPQVFSTHFHRLIAAAACGGGALALDVIAIIYHLCSREKGGVQLKQQEPVLPQKSRPHLYMKRHDLESGTRIIILAQGESAFDAIHKDFCETFSEHRTKGVQVAVEKASQYVRNLHKQQEGLVCYFDPASNTAYIARIGGQLHSRLVNSCYEISLAGDEVGSKGSTLTQELGEGQNIQFTHEGKTIFLFQ